MFIESKYSVVSEHKFKGEAVVINNKKTVIGDGHILIVVKCDGSWSSDFIRIIVYNGCYFYIDIHNMGYSGYCYKVCDTILISFLDDYFIGKL